MNLKNKYNEIVKVVENNIIMDSASLQGVLERHMAANLRLLGDAFQFISGKTLAQYIRERKLIHAVMFKNRENVSMDIAAERYGFHDASSMSKSFKTCFGKPPSQVTEEELKRFVPLWFERVLEEMEDGSVSIAMKEDWEKEAASFVLTTEQFALAREVLAKAAVYGLSDRFAELAYSIHRTSGCDMDAACEFVYDFQLQIENGSAMAQCELERVASLSLKYNLSYSEGQGVLYELNANDLELEDLPAGFFDVYFSEDNSQMGMDVVTICELVELMESQGVDPASFSEVKNNADLFYGGDLWEAIENFPDEQGWVQLDKLRTFFDEHPEDLYDVFGEDERCFDREDAWEEDEM